MSTPTWLLTDIDVRSPDAISGRDGMVEFAVFCEGEYVESIYVTFERASELSLALDRLLEEHENAIDAERERAAEEMDAANRGHGEG